MVETIKPFHLNKTSILLDLQYLQYIELHFMNKIVTIPSELWCVHYFNQYFNISCFKFGLEINVKIVPFNDPLPESLFLHHQECLCGYIKTLFALLQQFGFRCTFYKPLLLLFPFLHKRGIFLRVQKP